MAIQPLYTPANCHAAYQLHWSLNLFGKSRLPSPQIVIEPLKEAISKDNLRILEYLYREPNVAQFFVSSQPQTAPSEIVRSIKGRWLHLLRSIEPIDFRRNYRITGVGSAKCKALDAYIEKQPSKHPMADDRIQSMIEAMQFHDRDVNLMAVRRSSYGEFVFPVQIVLESEVGWNETRQEVLLSYRHAIIDSCRKHNWLLSRIGLLSNHIHVLVGAGMMDSPDRIALALLNNIVFQHGMKPIFRFSFYVGTFGAYDHGAIWNQMAQHAASARTSRTESECEEKETNVQPDL